MKNLFKTLNLAVIVLLATNINDASAQSNDAIRMILSSKTFTISDEFKGDSSGYTDKYVFTKNKHNIEVVLETMKNDNNVVRTRAIMPYSELSNIEKMFNQCVTKIKTTGKGSTEHSKYTFTSELTTYEIDDKSTMVCVNDIKTWKSKYFPESK